MLNPFKSRNLWPVGLVIFFILFVSYIVGFVIFASRQKMDLVRADYYDQEIRFQQQIDRIQRSQPVLARAAIDYDRLRQAVTVSLPDIPQKGVTGVITLYRPSDAGMDSNVPLDLNDIGSQSIDMRSMKPGLWKVRVQWKAAGADFYFEKPVVVGDVARL